jgi:cell division septum initiation protein DivIVA
MDAVVCDDWLMQGDTAVRSDLPFDPEQGAAGSSAAPEDASGTASNPASTAPGSGTNGSARHAAPATGEDVEEVLAAAFARLTEADSLLEHASTEAQSIVADAIEQSSLITGRAEAAADELTATGRRDAEQHLAETYSAARAIRDQAEEVLVEAKRTSDELRQQVVAEYAGLRERHDRQLAAERAEFDAALAAETREAAGRANALDTESREAAQDLIHAAHEQLESAKEEADQLRSAASEQAAALVEAARANIARELAEAAEQTAWTKQTMSGLRAAAELDAKNIRAQALEESEVAVRRARARIAEVISASRERAQQRLETTEQECLALKAEADDRVRDAEVKAAEEQAAAEQVRLAAEAAASRVVGEAEAAVKARLEMADRRMAEAETGARAIRERVADDMSRAQRESQETRRAAKREASEILATARAEADELRERARKSVTEARTEVERVSAQRDAISRQLGDLTGVIDALAVDGHAHPAVAARPTSQPGTIDPSPHPTDETMRDT